MEHNPGKKAHRMNPNETQQFEPVSREVPKTETEEFHPDILQFSDLLSREEYTLVGRDGFVRTNLKVSRLDKVGDTWMVTLFNPRNPESALDTLTLTLGEFEKQRQRTVIEH